MAQPQHGVVSSVAEVAGLTAFSLCDGRFFKSHGGMRTEASIEAGPADCTRTPSDVLDVEMGRYNVYLSARAT